MNANQPTEKQSSLTWKERALVEEQLSNICYFRHEKQLSDEQ